MEELSVSDNDTVRKGLEYRGHKTLQPTSALFAGMQRLGTAQIPESALGACCLSNSHLCPAEKVPCSWGRPCSHLLSLAANLADMKGFGSCQPWPGTGRRFRSAAGRHSGSLSPVGSAGASHYGISFSFFLPIYLLSFLGQLSSFIILTVPIYLICPLFSPLSSLWLPVRC